jgi:hypothetical protein
LKDVVKLYVLICLIGLFGCAANGAVQSRTEPTPSATIELECQSANRLGCRHKGRTYPWNAWVEVKGYDSKTYSVKDVQQTGNRAVVLVMER